jgi:hypothetical protein
MSETGKRWQDHAVLCLVLWGKAQMAGRITGILSMKAEPSGKTLQFERLDELMQFLVDEYNAQEEQKGTETFD